MALRTWRRNWQAHVSPGFPPGRPGRGKKPGHGGAKARLGRPRKAGSPLGGRELPGLEGSVGAVMGALLADVADQRVEIVGGNRLCPVADLPEGR